MRTFKTRFTTMPIITKPESGVHPLKPLKAQYGGLSRPLLALMAVTVLGVSATAITYLITNRDASPTASAAPAKTAPATPIFFVLEPFTVTLTSPHSERLLHVGITLKVADEASRQRLVNYLPVLRSRLLMLLSDQQVDELHSAHGKRELANAIRHAASAAMDGGEPQEVIDVLFTAFVVQ